jgi:hypothetical protein
MIQALQACFLYLLFPRLCLGLFMFKAFSLEASKMLVLGAFAPIPKGSNVNSPACNAGILNDIHLHISTFSHLHINPSLPHSPSGFANCKLRERSSLSSSVTSRHAIPRS